VDSGWSTLHSKSAGGSAAYRLPDPAGDPVCGEHRCHHGQGADPGGQGGWESQAMLLAGILMVFMTPILAGLLAALGGWNINPPPSHISNTSAYSQTSLKWGLSLGVIALVLTIATQALGGFSARTSRAQELTTGDRTSSRSRLPISERCRPCRYGFPS
jgi:hypothetical protein